MVGNICPVCGEGLDWGERHDCHGVKKEAPVTRIVLPCNFEKAKHPLTDGVWWFSLRRGEVVREYRKYRAEKGIPDGTQLTSAERQELDCRCLAAGLAPDFKDKGD